MKCNANTKLGQEKIKASLPSAGVYCIEFEFEGYFMSNSDLGSGKGLFLYTLITESFIKTQLTWGSEDNVDN